MKEARVSPAHAANLMADSDNALYGAQVIDSLTEFIVSHKDIRPQIL